MTDGSYNLIKIGPGLGSRARLWSVIENRVTKSSAYTRLDKREIIGLHRLSRGSTWVNMIPTEWTNIYGAYFDAAAESYLPEECYRQIQRDVPRTYALFTDNARLLRLHLPTSTKTLNIYENALERVLISIGLESGYCQGMNFIAALFILSESNTKSGFILTSYLVKNCHLGILFDEKCSNLLRYIEFFELCLMRHNLLVYEHFKAQSFMSLFFAVEWFTTCFLVSNPGELSSCVVDMMLMGFRDAMIRVGLAVLDSLEDYILGSDCESLQSTFKIRVAHLKACDIMHRALTVTIDKKAQRTNGLQAMSEQEVNEPAQAQILKNEANPESERDPSVAPLTEVQLLRDEIDKSHVLTAAAAATGVGGHGWETTVAEKESPMSEPQPLNASGSFHISHSPID